jgi:membrane peptidoglycan carboxypeptidase
MPSVPQIIRFRQRRRNHAQKNPAGRAALGCSTLLSLLVALTGVVLALLYTNITKDLPSLESLPALLDPPNGALLQPTRVYDRSGQHVILTLENPAAAGRHYLTLDLGVPDHISPYLVDATLATADPTFWHNPGFTLEGIRQDSHPRLAQRLVADLLLWNEPSGPNRALRERLLAAQIIAKYGRERVLTWFLNSADYGNLAYGADAAARVYFGKPASQLSLAESALLAAVSQSPTLNPLDSPQLAIDRGKKVIQAMLEQGLITQHQAAQADKARFSFQPADKNTGDFAPAFTRLVLEQLGTQFDLSRVERGGLKVITSLDYDLQFQAACTSDAQIARLESLPEAEPSSGAGECQAARLLSTLPAQSGAAPQGLGANTVVLDPHTGQVLALVGMISPGLDPSRLPGHPPGTLLTPFIYLTGFTRGLGPASLVWDIPGNQANAAIQSFDGGYHGPLRLRTALANDYWVPAENMLAQVGSENVWNTARQLGLDSMLAPTSNGEKGLLDSGEVTLLEASQAYGVFSNQGSLVGVTYGASPSSEQPDVLHPVSVLSVKDTAGHPWLDWSLSQSRPVISPQLAYLVTNVLSDEPARWPSLGHPNPLEIGRPAAAKIGRTQADEDAWTIGYTPQLVAGVWIGRANKGSSGHVPPNAAASIWHAIMQYASRSMPSADWNTPAGINKLDVCDPSGMLPTADCPNVVSEIFLSGSEPTQGDTLYRRLQINRETGRLATVFTPPELVEERVYLIVPPEAKEWARQAGLPLPPESYDVIQAGSGTSSNIQITSPEMFAYVRGKVSITGSADGSDFSYYRLQVGKGLNPQEWVQIGQDVNKPVDSGELGVWDTEGLSGLYAMQLLVVGQDQRIATTSIQVTVDNQPPLIEILYPTDGQEITSQESTLNFQASVSDDLVLQKVDFFMDGKSMGTLTEAPFSIAWKPVPGNHTLRVVATDLAGNTSQVSRKFSIKN